MPLTTIAGRIAIRNAIVFTHNIVAVVGLLFLFGVQFTPIALWALPGAGLILLIGYLLVILLGPICTRFRDVPLVISSVMQVTFFLTPIFWMPTESAHNPAFIAGNPFYHLIQLVRAPLLGEMATVQNWNMALWTTAIVAVLALIVASVTRKRLALWL